MHETTLLLIEVGAVLLGLSLLGRLANRLGFSPIPIYLLVGLALGEGGLFPLGAGGEFLEVGSEIGVILLLALLGIEYTADELVTSLRRSRLAGLLDLLNAVPGAALGLLLGWGPVATLALAGITWVSSSGVVAKMLRDLRRLSNRETPTVLSVLVFEDLAMAFYLPVLSAVVLGAGFVQGATTVVIAVGAVLVVLFVALRWGRVISAAFAPNHPESLLLGVLGLAMLVAGLADQLNVSTAVGAFLVGIALSGEVAERARTVLAPLRDLFAALFFLFFGLATDPLEIVPMLPAAIALTVATIATKVFTGWWGARQAGIGVLGRWRTGFTLVPRGEFSIVIAGLAVGAGIDASLAPLAAAYVLLTILAGPLLARLPDARWFRRLVLR